MTLQEIETSLTRSLTTITTHWDAMLTPRSSGGIAKAPTGAVTLADDHSDTDADTPRLERLLSLRREVMDCLNAWSRVIIEDRDVRVQVPHGTDVPGMCAFLARHTQWFAGHEAAQDAADELRPLANRVRQAAATPEVGGDRDELVVRTVNAGKCPTVLTEQVTCGATVRLPLAQDPDTTVTCKGCGTGDTVEGWIGRITGVEPLVTIPQLVDILRRRWGVTVTDRTLRNWYGRGRIRAAVQANPPLFDPHAVFRQLAEHESAAYA